MSDADDPKKAEPAAPETPQMGPERAAAVREKLRERTAKVVKRYGNRRGG